MYVFFVKCVILYFRLTYFCKVSTALSRTGLAFAVSPSTGLNIILTVTMAMITMIMTPMTMTMIDDDDITMAIIATSSRIPTLFCNYLIPGEQAEMLLAR